MIKFEEAYNIIMDSAFHTGSEEIPFTESSGRILVSPVRSDTDLPPFDNSTVDGFACRQDDLGKELIVTGSVAAGAEPGKAVEPGTCVRIMTGAAMPAGADYVFMLEESQQISSDTVKFTGKPGSHNIEKRGGDALTGDLLIRPGCRIRPQEIAIMAMAGCTMINAGKKVKAGVITTGNELIEPDKKPALFQIRNSNAWQLLSQVERAGGTGKYFGTAADSISSVRQLLEAALQESDIVIITGGISAGDYDFVPAALAETDLSLRFDSVAVQPGRPMKFWTGNRKIVFGLPGKPVSTFVQFELLVKPLMAKMMGAALPVADSVNMILGTDYSRKRADLMVWVPVKTDRNGEVVPVEYHGSGHSGSLHEATGLMAVPLGQSWIQKGETVSVRAI